MSVVENKVHVPFEALSKELRCPICLCILNDTVCVCACLHRFCQKCFEESLRKCGHHCPMCRQQIQSRRHVRKDAACDAFIKALNLRAIQQQIESNNPHRIIPFHIKFKKNMKPPQRSPPTTQKTDHQSNKVEEDSDIGMELENTADNTYMDVDEYLIRFEPYTENATDADSDTKQNPQWESWAKASDLFFLVKQVVSKKMSKENNKDMMSVTLYYNDTQIMTRDLAELRLLLSRLYTSKEHNDIVILQQKALLKLGSV
eukprot:194571_1